VGTVVDDSELMQNSRPACYAVWAYTHWHSSAQALAEVLVQTPTPI
jgi:hypothetical protein